MIRLLFIFIFLCNTATAQYYNYVVVNIVDISKEVFDKSNESHTNTCRKSVSGDKVILEFKGDIPDVFKDNTIYDHAGIKEVLRGQEWSGYKGDKDISTGKYFVTDYRYKDQLIIKINEWITIRPIEIKGNLWIIPYDLYVKYKSIIDNNIDLYKCVIRDVNESEFYDLKFGY